MGTALLILVEIVGWGALVLALGALVEAAWAKLRRRTKQTLID